MSYISITILPIVLIHSQFADKSIAHASMWENTPWGGGGVG